jgi:hypothetical protein
MQMMRSSVSTLGMRSNMAGVASLNSRSVIVLAVLLPLFVPPVPGSNAGGHDKLSPKDPTVRLSNSR